MYDVRGGPVTVYPRCDIWPKLSTGIAFLGRIMVMSTRSIRVFHPFVDHR